MVNLKNHSKLNLLYLLIFIIILLSGCGSAMNTASTNTASNDTGSAVFSLKWDTPTLIPLNKPVPEGINRGGGEEVFPLNKGGQGVVNGDGISYAPIDCTASGVSTVSATVYTSTGSSLATGGPWNCTDHAGSITGVPAGTSRKLVVHGKDSSGNIKYSGEQTGITVEDGKTSPTVTVTVTPHTTTASEQEPNNSFIAAQIISANTDYI